MKGVTVDKMGENRDASTTVPDPGKRHRCAVVIVAAGRGLRADDGSGTPKQFATLFGRPVLSYALTAFSNHPDIDRIVVVIDPIERERAERFAAGLPGTAQFVTGGASRQASVLCGLQALRPTAPDIVLVHDAARPFVSETIISSVIVAITNGKVDGAIPGLPAIDTLKRVERSGHISETIPRADIITAQTPQGFVFQKLLAAHVAAAKARDHAFTDDAALIEWQGGTVRVVPGNPDNLKITTVADWTRAEAIARRSSHGQDQETAFLLEETRTGLGYDVHATAPGESIILGGVEIPSNVRLAGHSDADVVLHALTDALLGTIGDGDIGTHFPPSDPQWRGASSDRFFADAVRRIADRGGRIVNLDTTVIAETPKIGPHREAIRARIAEIGDLNVDRISVKATTHERIGTLGRGEGIAAMAVATVALPVPEDAGGSQ